MQEGWTFPIEDLGEALFDFVEVAPEDLEACGVLNIDPKIIAALRLNSYQVNDGQVTAQVEFVFQVVSVEPREARTEIEVCCCTRDPVPFFRQIGKQLCHAYEKARSILADPAG